MTHLYWQWLTTSGWKLLVFALLIDLFILGSLSIGALWRKWRE